MRNFLITVLFIISLSACEKSIPKPDVIKFEVYATKIHQANDNEPGILYWYLRQGKSGTLYYFTSTKRILNFSEHTFHHCLDVPPELKNAVQLDDIVVYIVHLNGQVKDDI